MNWYHWLFVIIAYLCSTWYSLYQSASPLMPCKATHTDVDRDGGGGGSVDDEEDHCFYPLVSPGDPITLQLWIYSPDYNNEGWDDVNETVKEEAIDAVTPNSPSIQQQQHQPPQKPQQYKWMPVSTCRFNVTIPISGTLPIDVTKAVNNKNTSNTADAGGSDGGNNLCTVLLPASARFRQHAKSQPQSKVKPLQAKFRIEWSPQIDDDTSSSSGQAMKVVIGDVPLELTHIKEKRQGYFWNSGSRGSDASTTSRRNLLNEPTVGSSSGSGNIKVKNDVEKQKKYDGPEYVPYLKYGYTHAVMIRFVAEYRPYGNSGSSGSASIKKKRIHQRGSENRQQQLIRQDGVTYRLWNSTRYRPIVYIDDKSIPKSSYIELAPPEEKRPPVTIRIKVSSLSPIIDSLNRQIIQSFDVIENTIGLGTGGELDEIRYFLQDERLYRFLLTQVISYIHMWLDYLAFRDEIQFYKGKQRNMSIGLSTSTVISRFICSFIILLYLLDGGGTSWVVLLSLISSCCVEAWKVYKILQPKISLHNFPYGLVSIRKLQTGIEQDTQKYDHIAIVNLAMILYPLVVGWSIYALKHYSYKSWYSWFISNAANAVYTFGFIGLCPQLYINYRLKSVAHLPWKVFIYKIFNTFVDDVFAFLIEMPMKHRLMTLRDDVVFLILLVQVYMYRVDKTRTNEFGYSYEEGTERTNENSKSGEGDFDGNGRPVATTNETSTAETTTATTINQDAAEDASDLNANISKEATVMKGLPLKTDKLD